MIAMKKHTYYCIALRAWGVATCLVHDTLEDFTEGISVLYKNFAAPSQMDTCSIRAYNKSEAFIKAREYFNENGWNIIIPEKIGE